MNPAFSTIPTSPEKGARRLTFRSGGGLLIAGILIAVVVLFVRVVPLITSSRSEGIGDGVHVDSYGFDLSNSNVPRDEIVAAGFAKGALPALFHPPLLTVTQVDSINEAERGKYLVPNDRVIGVWVGNRARAYPLSVLNWHEVVNDTIAGIPIAVTYSPLCDGAVVFDRRVRGDTLRLGVSGLLFNSNLLMYDIRPADRGESLWSQLGRKAVAGPAAGSPLPVVPSAIVHWGEWRERFPETLVLDRDPDRIKLYKKKPYGSYFGSDLLRYPVKPLPPEGSLSLKSPVVVVGVGERWAAFPLSVIAEKVDERGEWKTVWNGTPLRFRYTPDPPAAWVSADVLGRPVFCLHAFWFAWFSMEPETEFYFGRPDFP